jgi:hypothetical protein
VSFPHKVRPIATSRISLTVGDGGWVQAQFTPRNLPEQTVYVRFTPEGDRWRAIELWLEDPTQELLRSLPLSRIEHALNASERGEAVAGRIVFGLSVGHGNPTPDDLPAHFKDKQRRIVQPVKLKRPPTRRLSDDFYKDVGRAYTAAVEAGHNPRKALAEASATPADTVARWITAARRRGYLPDAEPGKVSS